MSTLSMGEMEVSRRIEFINVTLQIVEYGSIHFALCCSSLGGKSAIMTATVVGLGGKATATSRGSSLKGFIQSGAGFAEISIWLKNRGPDAYHPDLYGSSIEVVRRIMADGAGQYKIKSCRGQVVSTKKEELVNILDQFNIQVCVWLGGCARHAASPESC